MRHRIPLPESLGSSFTVRDAMKEGVGRKRAAARDLARPFHGVRSIVPPQTPMERVAALAPRLRHGQVLGGETAMRVWGYPHPRAWRLSDDIIVVSTTDGSRLRARGVRGVRLRAGRTQQWRIGALPVADPIAALFMCAGHLTRDEIVIIIDALITRADNYPGLHEHRPLITTEDIERRLREWGRFPGVARVRDALVTSRELVESPKETETRLRMLADGLPEPEVQFEVIEDGRVVARTDLAYPDLKIAIEYEGDGHRTSREQWRRDIQRQRELEDLGWVVIRATQLDLADGGRALCDRIRRAMAR